MDLCLVLGRLAAVFNPQLPTKKPTPSFHAFLKGGCRSAWVEKGQPLRGCLGLTLLMWKPSVWSSAATFIRVPKKRQEQCKRQWSICMPSPEKDTKEHLATSPDFMSGLANTKYKLVVSHRRPFLWALKVGKSEGYLTSGVDLGYDLHSASESM